MSGASTAKKVCFCNHCRGEFTRKDLDSHFLCGGCRVIPGVLGHRDMSKRGIESGSPEYWEATKHQLNIVTSDGIVHGDTVPKQHHADTIPARSHADGREKTEFKKWRWAVYAAPELPDDVRCYLLALSEFADWDTGANCWPGYGEQGETLGRTEKQIRRLLSVATELGWVRGWRLLSGWRRSTLLYQFMRPATALHGAWEGPKAVTRKGARIETP